MKAWKDLWDVSCINRGYETGDSSKIKNDEKWLLSLPNSMPPFSYFWTKQASAENVLKFKVVSKVWHKIP